MPNDAFGGSFIYPLAPNLLAIGLVVGMDYPFPGRKINSPSDADVPRVVAPTEPIPFTPEGTLTFSKLDANYKSGNATRDDIPSHLVVGADIPPSVADLYSHMCPAGVYERADDTLNVNPSNCIDCKATDVIGPLWTPREGVSRPHYRLM